MSALPDPDAAYLVHARLASLIRGAGVHCDVGRPNENISPPYCFVWGPLPVGGSATAAGSDTVLDVHLNVQVVAASQANVLRLAGQVQALIDSSTVTLPGYAVQQVKVVGSTDLSNETQVIPPETNIPVGVVSLRVRFQATKEGVCP